MAADDSNVRAVVDVSAVGAVVRFNWPSYSFGLGVVVAVMVVRPGGPLVSTCLAGTVVVLAVVSLVGAHDVYAGWDIAPALFSTDGLPPSPADIRRLGVVHVGYRANFDLVPVPQGWTVEFVDLSGFGSIASRSLERARTTSGAGATRDVEAPRLEFDRLAFYFSAHEFRRRDERAAAFRFAAASSGDVLIVEHERNAATLVAFSLGWFHFFPRSEWVRSADAAELHLETVMTRFGLASVLRCHRQCG